MELACLTCKIRVCPHCALFGNHRGHEVREEAEIQEIMKMNTEQLKILITTFQPMISEINDKTTYWKLFDKYRAKKDELKN